MIRRGSGIAVVALALSLGVAQSASAQSGTFTNSNPTSVNAESTSSPYPSQLDVSGMHGPIGKVTVTLNNFSLTAALFDLMLVAPHGENVMLMSDIPSGITSLNYTFDDAASGLLLADNVLSGVFQPHNLPAVSDSDDFPGGGPSGPGGTTMSALNGQDANGTWKLYGNDGLDLVGTGSIGSWTLNITTLIGQLAASPTSKDFGSVTTGQSSGAQSFSLSNIGNAPLSISSASITGADASSFSLDSNSCTTALDPTAGCALGVTFKPTSDGAKTATLVVANNGITSPLSIALTGAGVAQTVSTDTSGVTGQTGQTGTTPGLTPIDLTTLPDQIGAIGTNPTGSVQADSPEIKLGLPTFSGGGTPPVGQPTRLEMTASDAKQTVTGVIVNFGEKQGVFAESACVVGVNKGGQTDFGIPYEFLTPGQHTITVTVFAGGCGSATSHTFAFTVDIPAATAGFRVRAHTATTIKGPPVKSACVDNNLGPTAANGKRVITAMLCILNEQRKLAGLKPLKTSSRLTRAALTHSKTMIKGQFFAHQGPRELPLPSRLKKVRYRGSGGENIAAGAGDLGTALGVVDGWMHSSLHRMNVLNKRWKYIGIGFVAKFPISGEFPPVATYTADFGNKR